MEMDAEMKIHNPITKLITHKWKLDLDKKGSIEMRHLRKMDKTKWDRYRNEKIQQTTK